MLSSTVWSYAIDSGNQFVISQEYCQIYTQKYDSRFSFCVYCARERSVGSAWWYSEQFVSQASNAANYENLYIFLVHYCAREGRLISWIQDTMSSSLYIVIDDLSHLCCQIAYNKMWESYFVWCAHYYTSISPGKHWMWWTILQIYNTNWEYLKVFLFVCSVL